MASKYLSILADFIARNDIDRRKIIDLAQEKIGRRDVYVLYSYGKDSGVVLDWAYKQKIPNFKGAIAINTTIHVPDWPKLVKEYTDAKGYDCQILTRPDGKTYEDCSLEYGFGGPSMHSTIMRFLKLDPLRAFGKRERENAPLFLSGIRLGESKRRFGTVQPISSDHGWFVVPLYNWSDSNVWQYFNKNKIARSPAYETLHISGDCLCGCFAQKGEFRLIEIFYAEIAERIKKLQERVREHGKRYYLWGDTGIELRARLKKEKKTLEQQASDAFNNSANAMVCGECGINRPAQFCEMKLSQWREMSPSQRDAYFNRLF